MKFKEGDQVKRVADDCANVYKNGLYTIEALYGPTVRLEGVAGSYSTLAFELVHKQRNDHMKFKIGDKVKIIKNTSGHGFAIGDIVTITETHSDYDGTPHYKVTASNTNSWYCWDDEIELAWTPQNGEMIEVSIKAKNWVKRLFIGKDGDNFVCKMPHTALICTSWPQVRQIKPTHTITVDGKAINISEESFQALKKSLNT